MTTDFILTTAGLWLAGGIVLAKPLLRVPRMALPRVDVERLRWWLRAWPGCWSHALFAVLVVLIPVRWRQSAELARVAELARELKVARYELAQAQVVRPKLVVTPSQGIRLDLEGSLLPVIHDGKYLMFRDRAGRLRRLDYCLALRAVGEVWPVQSPPQSLAGNTMAMP